MLARLAAGAALLAAAACAPDAGSAPAAEREPGFDFYVLSLSWSPSYCAAEAEDADRQQCDPSRRHAFVVHGLWPQFERGYPESCPTTEPRGVPAALVEANRDLIPSARLIRHQWRKHGTCSGLRREDYFRAVRAARGRVAVPSAFGPSAQRHSVSPEAVETAFLAANPGMKGDGIAVTCEGRLLREVRICLTKELGFRSCPEVDRKSCRRSSVVMPAAR